MSLAELRNAAAELSEKDRAELAAWLLDTLPVPDGAPSDAVDEALRRREELDSGKTKPLSSSEFWSAVDRDEA